MCAKKTKEPEVENRNVNGMILPMEVIEAKVVKDDASVFQLEDGTVITVKVIVKKALISRAIKMPDGNPLIQIDWELKPTIEHGPKPLSEKEQKELIQKER